MTAVDDRPQAQDHAQMLPETFEELALVAERNDEAGIPVFLLIDRDVRQVVVHSEPKSGTTMAFTADFGDPRHFCRRHRAVHHRILYREGRATDACAKNVSARTPASRSARSARPSDIRAC